MSVVIGSIFGTIVLSVTGLLFFNLNIESNASWSRVLDERFERMGKRLGTQIFITSTTISAQGSVVTATVQNVGNVSVGDFEEMDVLVAYTDINDTGVLDRLKYVNDATPSANEWGVASINPDVLDPGILNPGEKATLTLILWPAVKPETSGSVLLATGNGTRSSTVFTYTSNS